VLAVGGVEGRLVPPPPSQQAVDARDENRQFERLRQVIVRARFEASQHIVRAPSSGQHQDRHELSRRPQCRRNGKAVTPRQHDVEHHDVEALTIVQN
jgi:hypothetical protein